jgi:hypothetical protein
MTPRRLPLCLACSLAVLGPAVVLAAGLRGELSVERSPEAHLCPDAAGLAARVEAVVGRPMIVGAGRGDLSMEVQMSCSPAGCQARIRTRGVSQGIRDLSDPDPACEGLADALAITLAMLLDWSPAPPASSSAPLSSAVAPSSSLLSASSSSLLSAPVSASAEPPPGPPPTAPAAQSAVASSLAPRSLGVAVGGGLATGVLPAVAPLGSLEVEAQWSPWLRLSLGLEGVVPQSVAFQGGTVAMRYLAEGLVGCVPARVGVVEIGGCAALGLGQFQAIGSGFARNDSVLRLWWLGGLGAEVRGPLYGALGWSVRGLVEAQTAGQKVTVGALGTAAQLDRVGLRGRLALTWSIW